MKYLKQVTVLYAEDEQMVREGYARTLERYCKKLYVAVDGEDALEKYKLHRPDIVISDIRMPKMNGLELTKKIKEINPKQIILFTTAHTESNYTIEALNMQVDAYLLKPIDKNKLIEKLETLAGYIISERENAKHQEILQNLFNNSKTIQILTDFEDIEYASSSFFKLLQIKDKYEFKEKFGSILNIFDKCDECIYATNPKKFIKQFESSQEGNKIVSIKNQKNRFLYISIEAVSDKHNKLYTVYLTDISKLQQEKKDALYKASHDFLTGLYNKEKFNELYDLSFQQAKRYGRNLSLAVIDIDFFKIVNDTYGHIFGDEVLQKIAKCLKNKLRKTDIIARWGGEEFALLMIETDIEQAKNICEDLRKEVERIDFKNSCKVTVSIGVATLTSEDSKKSLFSRADKALYIAKESGKNIVKSIEEN